MPKLTHVDDGGHGVNGLMFGTSRDRNYDILEGDKKKNISQSKQSIWWVMVMLMVMVMVMVEGGDGRGMDESVGVNEFGERGWEVGWFIPPRSIHTPPK